MAGLSTLVNLAVFQNIANTITPMDLWPFFACKFPSLTGLLQCLGSLLLGTADFCTSMTAALQLSSTLVVTRRLFTQCDSLTRNQKDLLTTATVRLIDLRAIRAIAIVAVK